MMISPAYAQAFPAVAQATAGLTIQAGALTQGSAVVTGLSSTALFAAGMLVYGPGVPDGAAILSVDSVTQITLTQPATQTGTFLLSFPVSALLTQLIQVAQATIESYIKYPVEQATTVEYYSGNGYPELVLNRPNVSQILSICLDNVAGGVGGLWGQQGNVTQTGTTSASSQTVTGLADTSKIQQGWQVYGAGMTVPTWVLAILSPTSVSLTTPASASGTVPLTFSQGFANGTQLAPGLDYALNVSGNAGAYPSGQPLPTSEQGMVTYIGAGSSGGGGLGFAGWGGFGWGANVSRGTLTPAGRRRLGWPPGNGNIQCVYTAGWTDETMPADLQQACVNIVQWLALNTAQGGMSTTNESLGKYSYGLGPVNMGDVSKNALAAAGEFGTTRQLLSNYRNLSLGG